MAAPSSSSSVVDDLRADEWRDLAASSKAALLRRCAAQLADDDWAHTRGALSQWSEEAMAVEELTGKAAATQGAMARMVALTAFGNLLTKSAELLEAVAATGRPPSLTALRSAAKSSSATEVFEVFPRTIEDKLGMPGAGGVSAELWLRAAEDGHAAAPLWAERSQGDGIALGGVCVVLGAGNQDFLGFADAIFQLVHFDRVVVLKHHPLRRHLVPILDHVLAPLIARDFFRAVDIDLAETQILLAHPSVAAIHLTGGGSTHDAIVWGAGEEGARNRAARTPKLRTTAFPTAAEVDAGSDSDDGLRAATHFTSELGCVTPWIVEPSAWSAAQLVHHARALAAALKGNGSANCLAPKALVLCEQWAQKDAFLDALRRALGETVDTPAYYPGAQGRYERFCAAYEEGASCELCPGADTGDGAAAERKESEGDARAPLLLPMALLHVRWSEEGARNTFALRNEAFAPVLAVVELPHAPERCWMSDAARFVNREVWGALSCVVLTRQPNGNARGARGLVPSLQRDPGGSSRSSACEPCTLLSIDACIAELRYGSVCLNVWSVFGYAIAECVWGGYVGSYRVLPGEAEAEAEEAAATPGFLACSGDGYVGNVLGAPRNRLLKSVVRCPFVAHACQIGTMAYPPHGLRMCSVSSRGRSLRSRAYFLRSLLSRATRFEESSP